MDIGSSSPLPALPRSHDVIVVCPNCKAQNTLRNSVKERPCSLEEDAVETVSICLDCGHVKHIYYMSKRLRIEQTGMGVKIKILAQRTTQENLNKVIVLRDNYKKLFDSEQERFRDLLEKENGRTA